MGYLNKWKIALKGESPLKPLKETKPKTEKPLKETKPLKEFNVKTEIPDWAKEVEREIAEIKRARGFKK